MDILNMFGFMIHVTRSVPCRFSDIMHRHGDKITLKSIREIKPEVPIIFEREREHKLWLITLFFYNSFKVFSIC